jgi:hypothetical protein
VKILSVWTFGSNEIQSLIEKTYPGSHSINFFNTCRAKGEDIAFDELFELLNAKPDVVLLFQFYNRLGPHHRHSDFIRRAMKISDVYLYIHDTPTDIKDFGWKNYSKVFVPNFDRSIMLKKMGVNAEFLPPGCSRIYHIDRTPYKEGIELGRSVCFFVSWLKLNAPSGPLTKQVDRRVYLEKLLEKQIPVDIYGPKGVEQRITEMDVDKTTLKFHGHKGFYSLSDLSTSTAIFNGILYAGELSINRRFYIALVFGATQLYPACPYFNEFCKAFFGEVPSEKETPVVLFDNPDDFALKAKRLLEEPKSQTLARRKKAVTYREKWTFSDVVEVLGGSKENPSKLMETKK